MEKEVEKRKNSIFPVVINAEECSSADLLLMETLLKKKFSIIKDFKFGDQEYWKKFFGETFANVEKISENLSEKTCVIMCFVPPKEASGHLQLFHDAEDVIKGRKGVYFPLEFNDWNTMCCSVQKDPAFAEIFKGGNQ